MKLERLTCHTPVAAARAELIRRVDRTHHTRSIESEKSTRLGCRSPYHGGSYWFGTPSHWQGAVKLMSFPPHTSTRTTRQLVNNNPTKIAMSPAYRTKLLRRI